MAVAWIVVYLWEKNLVRVKKSTFFLIVSPRYLPKLINHLEKYVPLLLLFLYGLPYQREECLERCFARGGISAYVVELTRFIEADFPTNNNQGIIICMFTQQWEPNCSQYLSFIRSF